MDQLNNALSAYTQAERCPSATKLDLYFNRSVVYRYLEKYQEAVNGFGTALKIYPHWETAKQSIQEIVDMTTKIQTTIDRKSNFKKKKLKAIVKTILSTAPGIVLPIQLASLQIGLNKGKLVIGKIISVITNPTHIPNIYVFMDSELCCVAVSIYMISENAIKFGDTLTIADPCLKQMSLSFNDKAVSYKCIHVDSPHTLLLNGKPITETNQTGTAINFEA